MHHIPLHELGNILLIIGGLLMFVFLYASFLTWLSYKYNSLIVVSCAMVIPVIVAGTILTIFF